jgi:hypothetical protein
VSYSYKDQVEYLSDIRLKEGEHKRLDCPFCKGKNTFSISKTNGKLLWNCFRASCNSKGGKDYDASIKSIKDRLKGEGEVRQPPPIPFMVSINNKPDILKWLETLHTLEAYQQGLVDIRYAPAEDRVMFSVGEGFAGRSLNTQVKPKWKKYGAMAQLFTCGTGPIAVLVEDAPSACAVGVIPEYTGVSPIGTTVTKEHKTELYKYDQVLVALDHDAQTKGLEIANKLQGAMIKAKFVPLFNDLKYHTVDEIRKILTSGFME